MEEIKYKIADYGDCIDQLIAFRNANRANAVKSEYFNWRYQERPNSSKAIIVVAEKRDSGMVGALSLIPHHYYLGDREYLIGILGDISVSEEARGMGVAQGMLHFLRSREELNSLRALLVLPNEGAARPLQKADWKHVTRIERRVKILRFDSIICRVVPGNMLANGISLFVNVIAKLFSRDSYYLGDKVITGEETDHFDEQYTKFWEKLDKTGRIIGKRDAGYLNWRYLAHPYERHKIYQVKKNGLLLGYIVFRLSEDIARVVDYCVQHSENSDDLIVGFIRHIRKIPAIRKISVRYSGNSFMALGWKKYGFVRRSDYQMVMRWVKNESSHCDDILLNEKNCFFSAGDKDV